MRSMLILASRSPRRRELLTRAGIPFVSQPCDVDESRLEGEDALAHVRRLAEEKAGAVRAGPADIVLGADTIVTVNGEVLGKPRDAEDALRMLRLLSGQVHSVITGICLCRGARRVADAETTRVRFIPLTEAEIRAYVATGEPMDKAGAYAIQGLASKFIDWVEGCYFNVVGLPVALVYKHLREFGFRGE